MDIQVLVTIFVTAIITSAAITPFILRIACIYSLYDQPDSYAEGQSGRKMHSRPIPRLGGISILMSFLVCYFVWKSNTIITANVLMCSLLIFALGILDDILTISAKLRFVFQTIISGFAIVAAELVITNVTILPGYTLTMPWWLGLIFSIFIVVGAINSLNMIDGLDGLAGGVSIISLILLSYLYYLVTRDFDALLYLGIPIVGAVIGFLKYNTHPASIFMGDSGSNWLGFVIGIQILLLLNAISKSLGVIDSPMGGQPVPITLISVLMCFCVPIIDTALVIVTRMKSGLPPMSPDKRHFHHSLIQIGLTQSQSVIVIYFVCILGGLAALSPLLYPLHPMHWAPYIGGSLIFLVIGTAMTIHSRCKSSIIYFGKLITSSSPAKSKKYKILIRYWERANKYTLFVVLVVSPIFAGNIPHSIGYVAIPIAILLFSTLIMRSHSNDFFESISIGLACLIMLVANNQNPLKVEFLNSIYSLQAFYNGLFVFLFISSVGFLFITIRQKHLILNASDFLVLSFPLVLAFLPVSFRTEYRIDIISLRILVIYLCFKTLEKRRAQARRHVKMAVGLALIYLITTTIGGLRIVY